MRGSWRRRAGGPPHEDAVRRSVPAHYRPLEAGERILLVEVATPPGRVDADYRVMHDLAVARVEFVGPDVFPFGDGDPQHELAVQLGRFGRKAVRLGHRQHQVGLAQPPALRKLGKGRQVGRIPFAAAFGGPLCDQADLIDAEAAISFELAVPRRRGPGGHDSPLDHVDNLFGPLADVEKAHERKGADLSSMMAAGTFLKDDRGHVLREVQRSFRPRNVRGWRGRIGGRRVRVDRNYLFRRFRLPRIASGQDKRNEDRDRRSPPYDGSMGGAHRSAFGLNGPRK